MLEIPNLPVLKKDQETLVTELLAFFQNLVVEVNELVPTGSVVFFAGVTIPDGWLICDGAAYEIEDYKALAKAIGQTYGGAGTQFEVPDYQDKVLFGASATRPLATAYGGFGAGSPTIGGIAGYYIIKV